MRGASALSGEGLVCCDFSVVFLGSVSARFQVPLLRFAGGVLVRFPVALLRLEALGVGRRAAAVASRSDSCRLAAARGWSWDVAGSRGLWVLYFAFCFWLLLGFGFGVWIRGFRWCRIASERDLALFTQCGHC